MATCDLRLMLATCDLSKECVVTITLSCFLSEKHFSWTSPRPVAFDNGQALMFFKKAPPKYIYKISSYQGSTSKQTPIG